MIQDKPLSQKSLLIFVIVLFALVAAVSVAVYLSCKNYSPAAVQPTVEPTTTPTSIIDTSDWKTYRNEDIGIEFKYPNVLGTPEIWETDNINKKPEDVFAGKKVDIRFKDANNNYNWLLFVAYTKDYKSFKDFLVFRGNENISSECFEPLIYNNTGKACKIIEVANEKAIWRNYFDEDECSPLFGSQVYFNNKSQSVYKGLAFMFHLKDAEKKITDLYSCIDDKATERAYLEAVVQSKNIMEKKNLSENDFQQINLIEQILSTFKFIK